MRPARAQAKQANRRQHARYPLGLPVKLQLGGRAAPIIVEIVDVSAGGMRLRALGDEVRVAQRGTLKFVLPSQRAGQTCAASGQVARVDREGTFVLVLEESNAAFRAFIKSLALGGL